MSNILITSAGRRVSLVKAFITELMAIDHTGKVYVTDAYPKLSPAAQVAHKAFKVYKINNTGYIDSLLEICKQNKISLIIPTLDTELLRLSENRKKFSDINVQLVLSNQKFIEICNNKLSTQQLFNKLGISVPEIYSKQNYKLPLFIKPLVGSNSIGTLIIKKENQISDDLLQNEKLQFFEYLDHDAYDEYTCDLYYNKSSELKCVIPRKRIEVRGGEVSKGLTENNEVKTFIDIKLAYLEGARGCITLQLFMHKETKAIKGIEINPRFGGGFPLSYLAGGNYPKWIIQEYMLGRTIDYFDDWENNLLMLRYDDEILMHDFEG
ncbi:ATP-grasp domain-containing protein [Hwangdonia lutea]|uniref:ATP-grasp domain-containing protein n=1 Tax=Hwangdonia lutea TaxID=3075823 RepID=A0AA97HQA4_9FLAO|nr:ATP-grasp domain-containing protein [Hwangdonia sp. SCSIO 19198]WOD43427.1 ATP-grasp domain-containing protein [Hwangdonia sp. SCSIO 19198]